MIQETLRWFRYLRILRGFKSSISNIQLSEETLDVKLLPFIIKGLARKFSFSIFDKVEVKSASVIKKDNKSFISIDIEAEYGCCHFDSYNLSNENSNWMLSLERKDKKGNVIEKSQESARDNDVDFNFILKNIQTK